uniref:Uncharacterized protein n=1 Tax=Arundo donax TaxID=35708 RepID=A0A0A9CD59_ARUDO
MLLLDFFRMLQQCIYYPLGIAILKA